MDRGLSSLWLEGRTPDGRLQADRNVAAGRDWNQGFLFEIFPDDAEAFSAGGMLFIILEMPSKTAPSRIS